MQLEPVSKYRPPLYPTRESVSRDPRLLRAVPVRWRAQPAVLAALGAACGILEACAQQPKPKGLPAKRTCIVAPLFIHGYGRGFYGCVALNPPASLSEDEAREAIANEIRRADLGVEPATETVARVVMPALKRPTASESGGARIADEPVEWQVVAAKTPVRVTFVSLRNAIDAVVAGGGTWGNFSPRDAAALLSKRARAAGAPGAYGVFYDPLARVFTGGSIYGDSVFGGNSFMGADARTRRTVRQDGLKLLRAQVRDFIAWLKSQGVV